MFADDPSSVLVRDATPADGMRAARAIELTARAAVRDYVKQARQAGMSWHEIGGTIGLEASGEGGATVADAAFDYAGGPSTSHYAMAYGRSFPWACPSCRGVISDRGLCSGPCRRRAWPHPPAASASQPISPPGRLSGERRRPGRPHRMSREAAMCMAVPQTVLVRPDGLPEF
jgi:hypothetical protein